VHWIWTVSLSKGFVNSASRSAIKMYFTLRFTNRLSLGYSLCRCIRNCRKIKIESLKILSLPYIWEMFTLETFHFKNLVTDQLVNTCFGFHRTQRFDIFITTNHQTLCDAISMKSTLQISFLKTNVILFSFLHTSIQVISSGLLIKILCALLIFHTSTERDSLNRTNNAFSFCTHQLSAM